jgi:hypothetical protein
VTAGKQFLVPPWPHRSDTIQFVVFSNAGSNDVRALIGPNASMAKGLAWPRKRRSCCACRSRPAPQVVPLKARRFRQRAERAQRPIVFAARQFVLAVDRACRWSSVGVCATEFDPASPYPKLLGRAPGPPMTLGNMRELGVSPPCATGPKTGKMGQMLHVCHGATCRRKASTCAKIGQA